VDANLDPQVAALNLEIMAEAARNPEIGALVVENSGAARRHLFDILRSVLSEAQVSDRDLSGRIETIRALFEGLNQCIIGNPKIDKEAVLGAFRIALTAILSAR